MHSLRFRIALTYTALILLAMGAADLATWHWARSPTASSTTGIMMAAIAAMFVAAAIAIAFAIAGAVTEPLERLRLAARALASGSLPRALPSGGGAEVNELASAFNDMSLRLYETMRTREEEHSRLEALLASSTDSLVALDAQGVIRYLNRAAVRQLGNVTARQLAEVVRSPELTRFIRAALAPRSDQSVQPESADQTALIYLDARGIWLQATASPIAGGGGWALLVILRDVTDVRRAETTRRDFVANVSHELRTPLAGIKAVVETLRDGALDDPVTADQFLSQVDGEVDRLVQLVDELLQLARVESGAPIEMSDVHPEIILVDCAARFQAQAERAGVSLRLDLSPALPPISANAAQLGQALGNLVHNAIKFTPAGGTVTLKAEQSEGQVQIVVADTGIGIDPADLPRVFERFYVADRARAGRGTGLGLAIVKHVVRAHDGTVEAASDRGRGSAFTVRLPIAAGETHPLSAAC